MSRRPTFYPAYQDTPLNVPKFLAQPKSALLARLITALADLGAPKKALPLLHDPARITFYEAALSSLMAELPGLLAGWPSPIPTESCADMCWGSEAGPAEGSCERGMVQA